MVDQNVASVSTTNLANDVKDYSVNSQTPDGTDDGNKETWYDFPNSDKYLGYYKTIPELKSAIDALAIWTVGKGMKSDSKTKAVMENIQGWGEDSIQSIWENLIIQKKVLGDAFAEIIKNDKGLLVNLKPLYTGDMRVVVDKAGLIIRYEHRVGKQTNKFKPKDILHLCNDRIANEIHGTSVIESVQWIIDARNEALEDERKIKHRELAMGVLYVDSDDTTQIATLTAKYGEAVKNGEVLVLPKDTAELKDSGVSPKDRLQWIQYLENFFYQVLKVPRVIANAGDSNEASSKIGYLSFEPTYSREQTLLEADIWNQLAYRVKFNRPPSLHGVVSEEQQKNVGQTGIQQSEVQATAGRVE